MDRLVQRTERLAGLFLGLIAALTCVSIVLRGTLGIVIPDGFDVSRLLLAVAVFWGIAVASYRGEHIEADLLWQALPPRGRRVVDLIASVVSLTAMAIFAWMLAIKVLATWQSGERTFDLGMPIWPFHLLAALGIGFAVLLLVIRLIRLVKGR
jgi:TRAP-type C4-dicarboxylate transport system permease small subunit